MPRGVAPPPVRMRRIGVDLPDVLLQRLERQAAFMSMDRRSLIEYAILGLVREFERIDAEAGVACPDCGSATEVDQLVDGAFRVCVRCRWRWPEVVET